MHRCLLRRVPLSRLYFSHAWLFLRDTWRRGNAKGREHSSELAVRTFPQKAGCTAQPSWVLLLPPCWGCSPPELCATWWWIKKQRGNKKSRTGEWNEDTFLSVCFLPKGKVNNACTCVQKVAPPARACRQLSLPGSCPAPARRAPPPRLETASLTRGLSLLKGSQPFKPATKPVLALLGSRPLSPRVTSMGMINNRRCDWDLVTWISNWASGGAKALSSGIFTPTLQN